MIFKPGSINNSGTTSLNTPSSRVPFPLGLHALPLGLLDRACPQAGPTRSNIRSHMPQQWEQRNMNWLHPGITQWASSWGRPKRWRVKGGTRRPVWWSVNREPKCNAYIIPYCREAPRCRILWNLAHEVKSPTWSCTSNFKPIVSGITEFWHPKLPFPLTRPSPLQ